MKLVFVGNDLGEMYSFRGEIIKELSSSNEVVVIAPMSDACSGIEVIPIYLDRFSTHPLKELQLFFRLFAIYKKIKPDYIFHYTIKPNIYGTVAARLLGIPSAAVVVGLGQVFHYKNYKSMLARFMLRVSLRLSTCIVTINKDIYDEILSWRGIHSDKLVLSKAGEGIVASKFPQAEKDFCDVRFLVMAKLQKDKGVTEFKQAAEKVHELYPDVRFCWLGGYESDNPNAVSPSFLDDSVVEYHEAVQDVLPFLSDKNTAFVLPSYHEGLSRALMEACSVGCPCIVSDIAGCRELVDGGINGFLVQRKDAKSLAEAMVKFIELPQEQKRRMSMESRRIVLERASIDDVIDIYNAIIKLA